MKKLISNIGLSKYDLPAPLKLELTVDPKFVSLKLKQSAGKLSRPMVAVGDRVAKGDIIAGVNVDELGSNLHASISGTIAYIDEKIIRIESH